MSNSKTETKEFGNKSSNPQGYLIGYSKKFKYTNYDLVRGILEST